MKPAKVSHETADPKGAGVAAVDRAFAIMGAFGRDDLSLTLAELSARTGLYKSTILRLAESLIRYGYLQRLEDGRFQIGPTPFLLGARYQRGVRVGDVVLPLMRRLAEQTHESVSFYVPHGDVRVCLHRLDSDHEIRDHVREGETFPLSRGSGGGLLSAFLGARGEKYDAVRQDHYYISIGERNSETAGISAPVFGMSQRLLGSLTLSGPRSRIDAAFLEKVRVPVLAAAAQATASLGGDPRPLEAALAALRARGARTRRR